MASFLPIDEINALKAYVKSGRAQSADEVTDYVFDALVDSYAAGIEAANDTTGAGVEPDADLARDAIFRRIADKDFTERVSEYFSTGDWSGIVRVIETDAIRVYNDGVIDGGNASGINLLKRWVTVGDDRVRDTHDYLEGMTVPLNDAFYTFDGDYARYPGDFTLPQNNCNCRCVLDLVAAD